MLDPAIASLPYLTRKQLDFEGSAVFSLRIESVGAQNDVVAIRGATKAGPFSLSHTNDGTGNINTENFRLPDIPIFVSVTDPLGNIQQGDLYCTISLVVNDDKLVDLCSGFVHINKGISYPQAPSYDPMPNYGRIMGRQTSDPAANTELSISVANGETWRIIAMRVQFVTDANAANRRVHFVFKVTTRKICEVFPLVDQVATTTINYCVGNFGATPDETDNNVTLVNMPSNLILPSGSTITTETLNRQVGDNFAAMDVLVERWFAF